MKNRSRRLSALPVILAACVLFPACWTAEPDRDTLGELRDQVANFPIEIKMSMARWAANRVAFGYVTAHGEGYIGDIECFNPSSKVKKFVQIELREMISCLTVMQTTTYRECLEHILQNTFVDHEDDGFTECKWNRFTPHFAPEEMPRETEAERVADSSIVHALLGPPPPIEIQLMLMGLPGMIGPKGFLCVQVKQDWACAPNPLDDTPDTTSSASSGGGDR